MQMSVAMTVRCENLSMIDSAYTDDFLSITDFSLKKLICQNFVSACPLPPTSALNLTGWFAKPKPNPLPTPKNASGKRLKVLHLSDFHLDPRKAVHAMPYLLISVLTLILDHRLYHRCRSELHLRTMLSRG